MTSAASVELPNVLRILARERLTIDMPAPGRTSFFSHLGSWTRLLPGPWLAHRELLHALALANLRPNQRSSLARAVLLEHDREFGVGRLRLRSLASGLPAGGSALELRPRQSGLTCLYTWAVGTNATATTCDWLLLRAEPEWSLETPPRVLDRRGIETLVALGGRLLVAVDTPVTAVQVAAVLNPGGHPSGLAIASHPRFAPHLPRTIPDAPILLWPHDKLSASPRRAFTAVVLISAPPRIRGAAETLARERGNIELVEAICPDRAGRRKLADFWDACGCPRVLLRGDPAWTAPAASWLRDLACTVEIRADASQLGLFGR